MKRIAFVGTVGAGKTTLFNALQGNYSLARKTQAVEFNEKGDIDTPGEYFSHPRWYHALITTLQDVDTLIYVHAANDTESRLPAGLLDIGANKRHIAAISKTDMPDADVAVEIKAGEETKTVSGNSVIFVPPGDSSIRVPTGGRVFALFTVASADLAAKCANAATATSLLPASPWRRRLSGRSFRRAFR